MAEPQFLLARIPSTRKCIIDPSNLPEFEFCTNSFPHPNLLSADELFAGGVIIPLHRINLSNQETEPSGSGQVLLDPEPSSTGGQLVRDLSATPALTSSKRWTNIFKKSDKKMTSLSSSNVNRDDITNKKNREKKNDVIGVNAAELNINIWPFSRSRSAGNGATRPRPAATHRKVSSAPCSRSNSGGELKMRKWPSSPSRGGVHLGRSSPVWQARRSGGGEGRRKIYSGGGGGGCKSSGVLSLNNVPMCIGYAGHGLSCKSDENGNVGGGGGRNVVAGERARVGGNLFNIRGLFTRKVY